MVGQQVIAGHVPRQCLFLPRSPLLARNVIRFNWRHSSVLSCFKPLVFKMDYQAGSRVLSLESMTYYSGLHLTIFLVAVLVFLFVGLTISAGLANSKHFADSALVSYAKFFYASFLKPHRSTGGGQQSALESFYETQVCASVLCFSETYAKLPARPRYMMPRANDSFEAERICLDY